MSNNTDRIKNWLVQEIEILESTVAAEHSLEKLMEDRAHLTSILNELQNSSDTE